MSERIVENFSDKGDWEEMRRSNFDGLAASIVSLMLANSEKSERDTI